MVKALGGDSLRLAFHATGSTHHIASLLQIACSCADLEAIWSAEPLTHCSRYLVLGFLGAHLATLNILWFANFAVRSITKFWLLWFELHYPFILDRKDVFVNSFLSSWLKDFHISQKNENHLKKPPLLMMGETLWYSHNLLVCFHFTESCLWCSCPQSIMPFPRLPQIFRNL